MQYTKLGYTDIEVSKVCVGCMSFGGTGKVRALEVVLSAEDVATLEECCLPHPIVGTTNANPPQGVVLLDEKK